MKKLNIFLAIFFIGLSGAIYWISSSFPSGSGSDPGAVFWPRMIAVGFVIFSGVMLLETMKMKEDETKPVFDWKNPAGKKVLMMFFIFIILAVSLYVLGFVISSCLFIPAVMYVLGERRKKIMIFCSIGLTGIIYLFFSLLLHVTLPQPFFV